MKLIGLAVIVLLPAQPVFSNDAKLKMGLGKDLVQAVCTMCHSADYIEMNGRLLDRVGWEAVVNKMIHVMGAPLSEGDVTVVVDYLTKNYSMVKAETTDPKKSAAAKRI